MILIVFYFLKIGEPQTLLVGASAAIMGLIGAMGAIFLQDWWQEKSLLARQRFILLLVVVGIQFLIDYHTPHVSLISHIFGLIIGFMVGLILIRETT
jgi:rhomboid protease GluP